MRCKRAAHPMLFLRQLGGGALRDEPKTAAKETNMTGNSVDFCCS